MDYKIVVDSSSNLSSNYIVDNDVGFEVVPLTIRINDKDYIDDDNLNIKEMMDDLDKCKSKPTSSCPSPALYMQAYEGAKHVICITISSKLSGSFNSAFLASMDLDDTKVHVVDSLSAAGSLVLLVDKTYELIKQGLSYEEICEKIDDYVKEINLFFVLDSFDNLVRNGRMSKLVAFVATSLAIKPLCIADKGEIKVYKKLRTLKIALKGLVTEMGTFVNGQDLSNRTCIISCIEGDEVGAKLKELIEQEYKFKEVRLCYNRGLCSFYALHNGVIVCF